MELRTPGGWIAGACRPEVEVEVEVGVCRLKAAYLVPVTYDSRLYSIRRHGLARGEGD
jgi:hypothetical protein